MSSDLHAQLRTVYTVHSTLFFGSLRYTVSVIFLLYDFQLYSLVCFFVFNNSALLHSILFYVDAYPWSLSLRATKTDCIFATPEEL